MQNKINSRAGGKRVEIKVYGMDGRKGGWEDGPRARGEDQNAKQSKYHTVDKKLAYISLRKLQAASRNYHSHRVPHTRKNRERAQLSGQSRHG